MSLPLLNQLKVLTVVKHPIAMLTGAVAISIINDTLGAVASLIVIAYTVWQWRTATKK